ncbi:SHOCT domain-containing protein [Desulfuromonas sp. TF]|uniref:SHOCT domain-containing protein n=1 Tax=Desulfuromonas sp. TF TaxID=1232410 RepID=UPI0004042F45|nr:SHOCT domain-containing protein [Desulfuromonas sp. TF]
MSGKTLRLALDRRLDEVRPVRKAVHRMGADVYKGHLKMKRIALLLLVTAVFASACTSTKWVRTTVAGQHGFNVALEHYQEKGSVVPQLYDHPYEMETFRLKRLMGDLNYVEKGESDKPGPVFQAAEIERLAPVLAETLAKVDADQRIRFTSFNQGKAWIFSYPRKTEGVLFVEPSGQLNIAFNLINSRLQTSETNAIDPIYSSADPLKIKESDTSLSSLPAYAALHKFEAGGQAPMWVVADLERLKESVGTAAPPVIETKEKAAPAPVPKAETKEPPIEKAAPVQVPAGIVEESIKTKLQFLKELLDEGLISEEDYNLKKNELLNKIK